MSMDVTFESDQGFTSGSTDAGVKMTDQTKPAAPASQPQPAKSGDAGPKAASSGKAVDVPWPQSAEDAQRMIDRLMASPKFRTDYANSNNPERGKLVEGISELFKLANPEPGEEGERGAQTVQDLVENLPDMEKFAGIHQPDFGPNVGPVLDQGDWGSYVQFIIEANIASETAQNLADDYATRLAASGWKGLTAEDLSDLRTKYTGRLSPQVMDTLEKWVTTEVYPRMRAQRQAGGRS